MSEDKIPLRKDVPASDKWDLTVLYEDKAEWEADLKRIPHMTENVLSYRGHLADGPDELLDALKSLEAVDHVMERVHHYASLMHEADQGDAKAQEMQKRALMAYTQYVAATSFWDPELLAIPDEKIHKWIQAEDFDAYRVYIQKALHIKPYILSEKEEKILALQMESGETASNAFSLLTNVDMEFGTVKVDGTDMPLTHSTYSDFMETPDRTVRKEAYGKFYAQFASHANTIAALYAGSVADDIFRSRARGYGSSLEAALYKDKVPVTVYRNLIATVNSNLDSLHKYYSLRKRVLKLDELRHWDVYVPLAPKPAFKTSYEEAVEIVRGAMAPLGTEYTDRLCGGLLGGWCDRYENKGKRSGAFSSGCYDGYPFILLNYKDTSLRDVYTMAHEGGHSMHSWYSVNSNPFMCYNYTIFEAETASTFNEELVFEYLLKNAKDEAMKKYLIATRTSDILATLHRQTMFAEFELACHEAVEQEDRPLSTETLRSIYRGLLEKYFGPEMVFEAESDLEGLRIPHFYNAFYVYKYSTGISAALALAKRVTEGGAAEREDYFNFLKSGGSRYPIESLRVAGVDMESPAPVQAACDTFKSLVDQLDAML